MKRKATCKEIENGPWEVDNFFAHAEAAQAQVWAMIILRKSGYGIELLESS